MAKHPDDQNPKHKPEESDVLPIEDAVEDNAEVLDVDLSGVEGTPVPKTETPKKVDEDQPLLPPAIHEPGVGDYLRSDYISHGTAETGPSYLPNFSLEDSSPVPTSYLGTQESFDGFAEEPPVAKGAEIAKDKPVLEPSHEKKSGGDSSVENADQIVEEVLGDDFSGIEKGNGASSIVVNAEVVEENSDVLATEPVQPSSSVVEISELVEDVSEDVMAEEFDNDKKGSSIVPSDAQEHASEVVDALPASDIVIHEEDVITAEEASGVKAMPASPPPIADEVVESDFLADADKEPASIFTDEDVEGQKTLVTDSMAHKEEALDEILDAAEFDEDEDLPASDAKKITRAKDMDEDAVDLGSDAKVKQEPAADVGAEDDIDWDDIDALEGSKVTKKPEDSGQTVAFGAEVDSGTLKQAADEEDVLSDLDTIAEESSGVDLGKKDKEPISGIEPVAEMLDDDLDLDDLDDGTFEAKKKTEEDSGATELDAAAVVDDEFAETEELGAAALVDDDEEIPVAKKKKGKEEEGELVGAGVGTDVAKPVSKAKSGRRLPWGILLTTALLGGGAAGVWYLSPDLLEDIAKSSPNATPAKKGGTAKVDNAPSNSAKADLDKAQKELNAVKAKAATDLAAKEKENLVLKDLAEKAAEAQVEAEKKSAELVAQAKKGGAGLDGVNKLLQEAKIKESGEKGVSQLVAAKKDVEEKLDAINKTLAEEKIKGVAGLTEMIAARKKLVSERDELDQAIKTAYQELAAGGLADPSGDPREKIVDAAKAARGRAESPLAIPLTQLVNSLSGLGTGSGKIMEQGFNMATLAGQLAFYKSREPFTPSPDKNLDGYFARFQGPGRRDPAELAAALKDASWVLNKESKSTKEAMAKAYVVIGLASRLQEKFDASRDVLVLAAKEGAEFADTPWMKTGAQVLKELSDPEAVFVPLASKLEIENNWKDALEVVNVGLKVFPGNPRLLTIRGLVQVELEHGNAKKLAQAQKEIRENMETAAKDAAAVAEAAFVLGMLEEELGNFEQAESEFRKAIKNHRGSPDVQSRYIIALARLLQRDRNNVVPIAVPMLEEPEPKKDEPKKDEARLELYRNLLLTVLIGVQAPGDAEDVDPRTAARLQESIELAKKLIQSDNPKVQGQGYMILGLALSKKGSRTDGLKEYMKGLELAFPGDVTTELSKMMGEHPAFQQPDVQRANPALAEQYFGKGLHLFWTRNYPEAETQFRKAVQSYNQDARYQYFLGMSQLAQKGSLKRDAAYFAFEQGARLEAANRPGLSEVNASLERVQGPMRAFLDSFRVKAQQGNP